MGCRRHAPSQIHTRVLTHGKQPCACDANVPQLMHNACAASAVVAFQACATAVYDTRAPAARLASSRGPIEAPFFFYL